MHDRCHSTHIRHCCLFCACAPQLGQKYEQLHGENKKLVRQLAEMAQELGQWEGTEEALHEQRQSMSAEISGLKAAVAAAGKQTEGSGVAVAEEAARLRLRESQLQAALAEAERREGALLTEHGQEHADLHSKLKGLLAVHHALQSSSQAAEKEAVAQLHQIAQELAQREGTENVLRKEILQHEVL